MIKLIDVVIFIWLFKNCMLYYKMNYYYDIIVLKFKSVIRKNLSINFLDKFIVYKLFVILKFYLKIMCKLVKEL